MSRAPTTVAVITADIVGSSRYPPADRRRVDRVLRAAFRETERRFPGAIRTSMAFRITAGDEFQCVVADVPRVFELLTYLRAVAATADVALPIRFRAAVGVGALSLRARPNPYEQDGPAFVRARQGLEILGKQRSPARWTMLTTGNDDRDAAADAVLGLTDHVLDGWTIPQWEAVRWALLGHTRQAIAHEIQVAHQNVTKRLRAAGWLPVHAAFGFLGRLLAESAHIG